MLLALIGLAVGGLTARGLVARPSTVAEAAAPSARTTDEEIAALEQRVAADPDDLLGWQQLGALYVRAAGATGDPAFHDLADRALERADTLVPGDLATLTAEATLALSRHEFDDARRLARDVLAQDPGDPDALAVLVDADVELGRYALAVEHLQRLLDVRPGLAALARTSYLRQLHGDLDGAVTAMAQAATAGAGATADVASVTALLGDLHVERGDLDLADAAYRDALLVVEDLPRAVLGSAHVTAARGDLAAAIEQLTELTARVPFPDALTFQHELQSVAGDDSGAAATAEIIEAVARLQQASGQVVDLEMATFLGDVGDPRALDLAQAAYDDRPTVHAASALAWALRAAGDPEVAVRYAEESLRLGTVDAVLRYRAAAVFAAAGDEASAREQLDVLFAGAPWSLWRHRADAIDLARDLDVRVPRAWASQ